MIPFVLVPVWDSAVLFFKWSPGDPHSYLVWSYNGVRGRYSVVLRVLWSCNDEPLALFLRLNKTVYPWKPSLVISNRFA